MKKVLSTKTLDGDALAYAQTQNLDVQCIDFIETTAIPFHLENIFLKNFDAIAFTSANAVKYFFKNSGEKDLLKGKQVYALQGKTSEELLARGIITDLGANSASELADVIISGKSARSVLHVCGNLKLAVLEQKLDHALIKYEDLVVYQTLTLVNKKVTGPFDAILFFSPSGVDGFMALNNFENETVCCCIGQTTRLALKEKRSAANIILPDQPSPISMLSAVTDYFNNN